jgi:hypothetical protein
MAIKKKEEMPRGPIEIDLSGPDGNVFVLMGMAKRFAKQLRLEIEGQDVLEGLGFSESQSAGDWIVDQMKSGDYENAIQVFDRYFGEYVILYR